MSILLVEDDDRITDPLAEDLRDRSHAVDIAHDGLAKLLIMTIGSK